MWKKIILIVLIIALVGFVLIQLVPYGREHTNPSVVQEPNWDSPANARARRARLLRLSQQRDGVALV